MKTRTLRVVAASVLAGAIALTGPMSVAHAATVPDYDDTTDAPVWVLDGLTYAEFTDKEIELAWGYQDNVYLSGSPAATFEGDTNLYKLADPTADAHHWRTFIASPGQERTRSAWGAWGDPVDFFNGNGPQMPQITPEYQSFGTPANIKSTGGTYSAGVAYLDALDKTVIAAYYVTINVDAGSGNWKFSTPTVSPEKETTTTDVAASASSVRVGRPVTLTATVKKEDGSTATDATGNVVFKRGSTTIETVGVANGLAVHLTQSLPVDTHAITAEYSGDDAYAASTSAAATVEVTAIAIPDEPTTGDPGFAENAVTLQGFSATVAVDAAHNGKAVNVFAYSEGQFISQQTVANGSVTVDLRSLPVGDHTLVVTDDADDAILLWSTFNLDVSEAEGSPADIPVHAAVRTSQDGDFKLVVPAGAEATLSNPTLDPATGESVSEGSLPEFQVVDERVVNDRGWTLTTTVAEFVHSTDSSKKIANTALGLKPNLVSYLLPTDYYNDARVAAPVTGDEQVAGTATYGSLFAELGSGQYNPDTKFDADLSFRAPVGSLAGTYNSTLTLTLVSK